VPQPVIMHYFSTKKNEFMILNIFPVTGGNIKSERQTDWQTEGNCIVLLKEPRGTKKHNCQVFNLQEYNSKKSFHFEIILNIWNMEICYAVNKILHCYTIMLWVRIPLMWGVLDTTLCDKVCQRLAAGRLVFSGYSVFRHVITEILLKMVLNTKTPIQ
jgi:hypothetical protein